MDKFTQRVSERRNGGDPFGPVVPGFYRVGKGSLVEIGDQTLDERGRPHPISLDQVGRQVSDDNLVVLRIDRRQQHD